MPRDAQGLPLTTASAGAATLFDDAVHSYVRYRVEAIDRLHAALADDPEAPLALVLHGAFLLFANRADLVPEAARVAATAQRTAARATPRERAHAAALAAWVADDMDRAVALWEAIMAEHPRDLLAFRLHHHNTFWIGRRGAMRRASLAVLPHWSGAVPGWPSVLGCHAFACEENGALLEAESMGREAVALAPDDLWAVHAVAHVLEMQGRRAEGIAWIDKLAASIEGGNSLRHHLSWHQALHHLECGDWAAALRLYDRGIRDLDGRLTRLAPDLATDVQNAASLLFRLQRHGVDIGDRWAELADKAEQRIGDCRSAFTLPHWMMALAATGRVAAGQRMLAAMRDFAASGHGHTAKAVTQAAIPACEALLYRAQDSPAAAVAALRPALDAFGLLGGSHAQHDVLEQLFLDVAVRAGAADDVRLALERAAGRYALPPARRIGFAAAFAAH